MYSTGTVLRTILRIRITALNPFDWSTRNRLLRHPRFGAGSSINCPILTIPIISLEAVYQPEANRDEIVQAAKFGSLYQN